MLRPLALRASFCESQVCWFAPPFPPRRGAAAGSTMAFGGCAAARPFCEKRTGEVTGVRALDCLSALSSALASACVSSRVLICRPRRSMRSCSPDECAGLKPGVARLWRAPCDSSLAVSEMEAWTRMACSAAMKASRSAVVCAIRSRWRVAEMIEKQHSSCSSSDLLPKGPTAMVPLRSCRPSIFLRMPVLAPSAIAEMALIGMDLAGASVGNGRSFSAFLACLRLAIAAPTLSMSTRAQHMCFMSGESQT
mmetsp:Transcript_37221/g.81833  ORF Transcript_37221/g.81833 Transcript_37221/m.81833 type:complete len:251 (+) Transcript_37221:559-1311(+)